MLLLLSVGAAPDEFNYMNESPTSNKLRICDGIVGVFIDNNKQELERQLNHFG